jgi:hypothetical protein
MAKESPSEIFLKNAVRTLVPSGRVQQVYGMATLPVAENMCHFVARNIAESMAGAVPVAGWTFEELRRHRPLELYVVFDYHSVVRMPDGSLKCPSTPADKFITFIEDSVRPFDYAVPAPHNLSVYANHQVTGERGSAVSPFTLTWAAPFDGNYVYSGHQKHSRWVPFGQSDPFEFARSRGLSPDSIVDMAFASDICTVALALGLRLDNGNDAQILRAVREAMPRIQRGGTSFSG